ncbi:Protein kinase domain-containing protein [Mycena indigotica]|uniref:Protein kinase domain-containing protein n=1 Tax=Mycena indigotica TaxID=2126181 RepID=A0A8H6W4Y3_9AGAR|nr:Protein kinase domain-containing protein [Mycena indigotica]KAF7299379.1 Protein kinase domain-containing protein [Mycena indigotica]
MSDPETSLNLATNTADSGSPPVASESRPTQSTPPRRSGVGRSASQKGGNGSEKPIPSQTPRNRVSEHGNHTRRTVGRDDPDVVKEWKEMLNDGFGGVLPLQEFFEQAMGYPAPPNLQEMTATILGHCEDASLKATEAAKTLSKQKNARSARKKTKKQRQDESALQQKMMDVFGAMFRLFPKDRRPALADMRNTPVPSLVPDEPGTRPDVVMGKAGVRKPLKWLWRLLQLVFELKLTVDIIDAQGGLKQSKEALLAARQLGKSARNLLMSSGGTHVFAVSIFDHEWARIFRFDHGGFQATEKFQWTRDLTPFIQLFVRMYRIRLSDITKVDSEVAPTPADKLVDGGDDTVRAATDDEQKQLFSAIQLDEFYKAMFPTLDSLKDSRIMLAARRTSNDLNASNTVVHCITMGRALSISDGLFSRATCVYRVAIMEDFPAKLSVFALKDVWKQGCRRDEIDFYDVIAHHIATLDNSSQPPHPEDKLTKKEKSEGMAKCHGSIDLSQAREDAEWNPALHKTCTQASAETASASSSESTSKMDYERHHVRSLITPVGRPLKEFPSTKALFNALYTAALHHETAFDAGVLHRDISEGNILFDERTMEQDLPDAFLVDWDYAELVGGGPDKFEDGTLTGRMPVDREERDKSLKRFTGTFPFMALETIDVEAQDEAFRHQSHHDLESLYWVLIWMSLRHTVHIDPKDELACDRYFNSANGSTKSELLKRKELFKLFDENTRGLPLFTGLHMFANAVSRQNAEEAYIPSTLPLKKELASMVAPPVQPLPSQCISHRMVHQLFELFLPEHSWPSGDKALPFHRPTSALSSSPLNASDAEDRNSTSDEESDFTETVKSGSNAPKAFTKC